MKKSTSTIFIDKDSSEDHKQMMIESARSMCPECEIIIKYKENKNRRIELSSKQKDIYENLKLKMELVPESCWWSNVRNNINKEDWNLIKKDTHIKPGYKCEICGETGDEWPVECHEKWEYNNEDRIQKLTGFISLCPNCHKVKHMGHTQILGRNFQIEAMKRFMNINSLSKKDARLYYDYAFQEWRERSKIGWNFDISYIKEKFNSIDIEKTKFNNKERK